MRTPRTLSFLVGALVLASAGCATKGAASPSESTTSEPATDDPAEGASGAGDLSDRAISTQPIVGKELPRALVAELRLRGDDPHGRLLTLAPGFIATAACSDCGAPSYPGFLAVRCTDERHCEVLTQECEGKISRGVDTTYELDFHAVEGSPEDSAAVCADYSGTFEAP